MGFEMQVEIRNEKVLQCQGGLLLLGLEMAGLTQRVSYARTARLKTTKGFTDPLQQSFA